MMDMPVPPSLNSPTICSHLLAFDLSGHASGASPSPPLQI